MATTRKHVFETDDPGLAAKLDEAMRLHGGGTLTSAAALAVSQPAPTPPAPPAAPAAPAAPTPPAAAPAPPAAPVAAAPTPPAAAPAPPAAPAAAAAPAAPAAAVDPLQIAPAGYTIDNLKDMAAWFTGPGNRGTSVQLAAMLARFCPPGSARTGLKQVYPAYWEYAYNALRDDPVPAG